MIDYERQAITSTARLPRHPGPHARQIICRGRQGTCGKWLGVADGHHLFMRDDKREVVATLPATVRCERCGTVATVTDRAPA